MPKGFRMLEVSISCKLGNNLLDKSIISVNAGNTASDLINFIDNIA